MLVLTRKNDEAIRIGDDIVIRVVAIEKGAVRLGIEAPRSMTILREELIEAVTEENRKAAQPPDTQLLTTIKTRLLGKEP